MRTIQLYLILNLVLVFFSSVEGQNPNSKSFEKPKAFIIGNYVNVRSSPSLDAEVTRQLQMEDVVVIEGQSSEFWTIDGKTDRWYEVANIHCQGWVFGGYLKFEGVRHKRDENLPIEGSKLCNDSHWEKEIEYDCQKKLEQEWIRHYPEIFNRNDTILTIILRNGKKIEFVDNPYSEAKGNLEDASGASLVRYWATQGLILIGFHRLDYGHETLYNVNNGETYPVVGIPIVSPTGRYFASSLNQFQSDFHAEPEGILSVLDCQKGNCIEVLSLETGKHIDWAPGEIKWRSDSEFTVDRQSIRSSDYETGTFSSGLAVFKLTASGWKQVN